MISRSGTLLVLSLLFAGCAGILPRADGPTPSAAATPTPTPTPEVPPDGIPVPAPTCGGGRPSAEDALPCESVARIALEAIARETPDMLRRGIAAIDVHLEVCSPEDVPATVECTGAPVVQFVTVAFGQLGGAESTGGALTVVVEPVTGRVLGISDELVL